MQVKTHKLKACLVLRAAFIALCALCFAMPATAQEKVKMKNGSVTVPSSGFLLFYDSGGEHQKMPIDDQPNDYNWVNMYQSPELYELTFMPNTITEQVGIEVTFEYVNINNDWLYVYEGTSSSEGTLIGAFTGDNDYTDGVDGDGVHYTDGVNYDTDGEKLSPYENNNNKLKVQATGPITFRFEADDHWRDHGWRAKVQGVTSITQPTPPVVLMQKCANALQLFQTTVGSTIYYSIGYGEVPNDPDSKDPLSITQSYTPGEVITIPENATYPVYVKAVSHVGNTVSTVSTYKFEDALQQPTAPNLQLMTGTSTVHVTTEVYTGNDTYYVRYTTSGEDPTTANPISQDPSGYTEIAQDPETKKVDAYIVITEPCTLQAVKRGTNCPENFSVIVSLEITTVYVPAPEITITESGSTTIECAMGNATIKYTTDGSDPKTSSTAETYGGAFNVNPGTTVKAYAFVDDEGYEPSPVATEIYVPASGSGVYGDNIVLLDDREDHNLVYYQKAANLPEGYPTDYLTSPDPRNVKITYKGGSVDNASAVAISALTGEGQNEMIYLKTMEKTVAGMTGNYPYTVISNPFSKRPRTNNSTGTNGFYGFAGWKVISGGEYISEYNNGQTLPLDATIHFTGLDANYTTNCLSADVVFEATWTQATVKTGSSAQSFTGGTYETNFWVLSGNSDIGNIDVPGNCTMSARYPNGTSNFTRNLTGRIQAGGNNAKVEFVNMNSTSRVSAEGYTFTMGRGIENSSNGGELYGCRSDKACEHVVKIESGKYSQLRNFGASISSSNAINQLMILGCDYDRAKGDNAKLNITGSMYVGSSVQLNRAANSLYVRTYIKSGNLISGVNVNANYTGEGGEQTYYFSVANTSNTGYRYLEMEGGHIKGIAGGMDETDAQTNTSRAFDLRVRGTAQIDGVVYGAAEYANAKGIRKMIFTGGTINGWIAGGANGTQSTRGALEGTTYLYVGGKTKVNSNGNTTRMNRALGGNVFGAGCGYSRQSSSGQVQQGTNVVIADSAYVERGVYGGGSFGYTTATANIFILGDEKIDCVAGAVNAANNNSNPSYDATIPGGVFGGACQNQGGITNITITKGLVNGNVYGGSNVNGIISGLATIKMSGGTVNNVYGGGYGASTDMASGTIINVQNGTINNNVYGGGQLGTVSSGDTHVNISGGTMKDVFGAGKGGTNNNAQVSCQTYVNVTGGSMVNVYGGGEAGDVIYGSGSSSNEGCEYFEDQTPVGYNANNGQVPDGWNVYRNNTTYAYLPRVSNLYNYYNITNNDGNYLLFTAYSNANNFAYAIAPKYNNIESVTFRFRLESANSNRGTLYVGYVTDNTDYTTWQTIATLDRTTTWTPYTLTEAQINTINQNNGYLAFRFGNCNRTSYYSGAIDDVCITTDEPAPAPEPASLVTIAGGTVSNNVFGGGKEGFTDGAVTVNMDNGTVEGSVFGGAFGKKGTVYVAGLRTVNMRGGTVNKNVYGGSRNGDDALTFSPGTFASSNETETASVVNFSGGHVYYQVFASGYFGNVFGSTYAFIGTNAIMNAPHHIATTSSTYNADYYGNHQALQIDGSVWAGGDFGNYDGTKFGDPTVTGNSCVYVDGTDYETNGTTINNLYMNIGGSLYGCGTSCDAGKKDRHIILREYGDVVENPDFNSKEGAVVEPYTMATRSLYSIQRADSLDIDNAHVNLLGQGKINSLVTTEHYSIHEFKKVRISNGSSLFLYAPADQIVKFGSYHVDDVYKDEPTYTKVVHAGETSTLEDTPNKIRVNTGTFIMIHHDGETVGGHTYNEGYGELEGFAYMMTEGENETCAYARPRQGTDEGNTIPSGYDNPNDGGWVSYNSEYNTFYDSGASGCGEEGTGVMQMPYENHTAPSKNGEAYFRIWRYGSKYLYREGVFVAQSNGTSNFSTTDVVIPLTASLGQGSYFRIKSLSDGNTTINYGDDVMTVNAAYTEPTVVNNTVINPEDGNHSNWMYFSPTNPCWVDGQAYDQSNIVQGKDFIINNPNVNFGLVAIPQGSIEGQQTLLICESSDDSLAVAKWYNTDETKNGSILFRLTYNNALTNNVVWDPITIVFEHVNSSNNVKEEITVKLTVTTLTNIEQPFSTEVYAIMRGDGDSKAGTYTAKVVLPQYVMNVNESGEISQWTCLNVTWEPNEEAGFDDDTWVTSTQNPYLGHDDQFALTFKPGLNYDQTTGWDEYYQGQELNSFGWNQPNFVLGRTTARDPIAFDFTLQFDEGQHVDDNVLMGKLVFKMHFTNYASAAPTYEKDLYITVYVYRIGLGNIYYLDGVHGNNLYSGTYPNAAKKSLSGIFNRTDYRYGDYIFVVNTVTANGSLEWNGKQYQEVTLYRYPGRHELADYADLIETSYWEDYDRANNACFEGALVQVGGDKDGDMTMNGIVLDGFHELTIPGTRLYPQLEGQQFQTGLDENENPVYDQLTWSGTYVNPSSPLVNINNGSTLTMFGQSRMTGNYSKNDGGAVYNAGTFNIYDGSEISGNAVLDGKNGGGVYLASNGKLQLSDLVTIDDNHLFTEGSKADVLGIKNNVYLPDYTSTVTVGTATTSDVYTALDNESRIGITSLPEPEWIYNGSEKWYLPVAFSDGGLANYLQNIIDNGIIFDDKDEYDVVSLNNADWVNNPTDYLYFVGTWVTAVKKNPQDPAHPNNFNPLNIATEDELAWLISYVNGLNHADPHPNTVATLAADLDMNAHIWVPIGSVKVPYKGDFDGNGHVVVGLRSPLNNTHMGMFGITNGAEIGNVIAEANFQGGTMKNLGTIIGTMNGGTLSNVEAAGTLVGTSITHNMGGLVGVADTYYPEEGDPQKPVIHSGFAVNTMTGGSNTVVGGLVGTNGADLYNSYANATMGENNQATLMGGLVGINQTGCTVENCYVINPIGPAFAYTNNGNINYCYAAKGTAVSDYVTNGTQPTTHGTYDVVKGRKELGYMYDDNKVEKVGTGTNNCIKSKLSYANGQISTWPGLLSTLNQWVDSLNMEGSPLEDIAPFTPWFRSTSSYLDDSKAVNAYINGDLPVLGFPKDNSMGTLNSDGKFLRYGSNVDLNGIDALLGYYNEVEENVEPEEASLFLYDKALDVTEVPAEHVSVYINEDATLKQSDNATEDFGNTTVGVTFDNSDHGQKSYDYWGAQLTYDWHMLSTSLSDAKMGALYKDYIPHYQASPVDIKSLEDSYFPNDLPMDLHQTIKWDFYNYYEPEYHWINLKRNKDDHWHTDIDKKIDYNEIDQGMNDAESDTCRFTPAKGYMMAISQDTYMSSTGTLNRGDVSITLTAKAPEPEVYNKGWNLIGNPYQAYLDLDELPSQYTFYTYDADQGFYAPYSQTASENPVIVSQYIHPHQAFFVKTATDNTKLTFTPSMATGDKLDGSYYREQKVNYPLVNLIVENELHNKDLAVIEFHRPELGGAYKLVDLNNTKFRLAARFNDEDYGILFTPENTDRVPVWFTTKEDGVYTMTWSTYNGYFSSLRLIDNLTGVNYDMLANDSYTFEASTNDYASRFYITFTCTDVEEFNQGNESFAFFDGSEWVVNGKGYLEVVDVMGRVLFAERLTNDQNRVSLSGVAKGVYLMRVSDNKTMRVQKIVVR